LLIGGKNLSTPRDLRDEDSGGWEPEFKPTRKCRQKSPRRKSDNV